MENKRSLARLRKSGYPGRSVRDRIEQFFLHNVGRVATRDQIREAAKDPKTGRIPENWHQRLSELRTDAGYTILSWRNRGDLAVMEYLMPNAERRPSARRRARPTPETWSAVLERARFGCEWEDSPRDRCGLQQGAIDPIGGGTVHLTPDHLTPHQLNPDSDPHDPAHWRALCGRHQVVKKNFWDDRTGKLNVYAIVQAASVQEKRLVYEFLKRYFAD
jgi:hypothetical protein